jgi:hypothetical protein
MANHARTSVRELIVELARVEDAVRAIRAGWASAGPALRPEVLVLRAQERDIVRELRRRHLLARQRATVGSGLRPV